MSGEPTEEIFEDLCVWIEAAWKKYFDLFQCQPHGTLKQVHALLELGVRGKLAQALADQRQQYEKRIAELEAKQINPDCAGTHVLKSDIRQWEQKIKSLREAGEGLAKYKNHIGACGDTNQVPCICGLDEALARWEKAKGEIK